MTTMTFTAAPIDGPDAADYAAGMADAYDEHRAGLTVEALRTRLDWLLGKAPDKDTAYVRGYSATFASIRLQEKVMAVVEAELAYEDRAHGRDWGGETR